MGVSIMRHPDDDRFPEQHHPVPPKTLGIVGRMSNGRMMMRNALAISTGVLLAIGCGGQINDPQAGDAEALASCNDGNPCTQDSKSHGRCVHTLLANNTACII